MADSRAENAKDCPRQSARLGELMSGAQINLCALRRLFSEQEWAALSKIPAFDQLANNLECSEDINKVLTMALDVLEQKQSSNP